jgi:hypothetical protein
MPLANYRGGMDAIVHMWDELGRLSAEEVRAGKVQNAGSAGSASEAG